MLARATFAKCLHETSLYHSVTDMVTHLCNKKTLASLPMCIGMCSGVERFHHSSLQIQLRSILKMMPIKDSIHYALGTRKLLQRTCD